MGHSSLTTSFNHHFRQHQHLHIICSISPYFFNAGLMSTGPILSALATAYAATIATSSTSPSHSDADAQPFPEFDVLFGPAYKGIPFASCTAVALYTLHGRAVGFAYDRKEAKDHGEGGSLVGVPLAGKRVLVLDDVMTAGTAIRHAINLVTSAGGMVVGVVQCLDREEVGKEGGSTVKEIEPLVGGPGRVKSILKMRDLMEWLKEHNKTDELGQMQAYWNEFGIKE
jgi:orotate phosphoribosyltransferase